MFLYCITISRQSGSLGDEIAVLLSQKLGVMLITHDFIMSNWLPEVASEYEIQMLKESPRCYRNVCKAGTSFANFIEHRLKNEAEQNSVLIQGLGSQIIFHNHPSAINIRIVASDNVRKNRLKEKYGLSEDEVEKFLDLSDRKHRRYISTIYEKDWADPALYDICLNTDNICVEEAVGILSGIIESHKDRALSNDVITVETETGSGIAKKAQTQSNVFAHESEEEFSKILDMYNIQWEYEPKTFPIEWDAEGNVTKAFTPDFFLPIFYTYIELTTMDQKYVNDKKKKVRRLREIYPDININIIFKKDYHVLLKRYGIK